MLHPIRFTPPPRRVPPSLAIVNFFNPIAQIGWLVFGFGMIFFWGFVGNADLSFLTFRGDILHTAGRVTALDTTGASIGDVPVVATHYRYRASSRRWTGTSYTTGHGVDAGSEVTVEFLATDPGRSRIAGMRRAQFGPGVTFVTIFPFIGFVILYFATKIGVKRNRLLHNGIFTTGTLTGKEATNMTVNKSRVYELTFAFNARDGRRCEAKARSHDPSRLEDDAQEPLLYDPEDPSRVFVLDQTPSRPRIDTLGELQGRPIAALFSLLLPAIVIGGHALFFHFMTR